MNNELTSLKQQLQQHQQICNQLNNRIWCIQKNIAYDSELYQYIRHILLNQFIKVLQILDKTDLSRSEIIYFVKTCGNSKRIIEEIITNLNIRHRDHHHQYSERHMACITRFFRMIYKYKFNKEDILNLIQKCFWGVGGAHANNPLEQYMQYIDFIIQQLEVDAVTTKAIINIDHLKINHLHHLVEGKDILYKQCKGKPTAYIQAIAGLLDVLKKEELEVIIKNQNICVKKLTALYHLYNYSYFGMRLSPKSVPIDVFSILSNIQVKKTTSVNKVINDLLTEIEKATKIGKCL